MNYLNYAGEAFLLIPLSAIFLNNICNKRFIEKHFHILTGAVALLQMIAAVFAFYIMDANQMLNFDFSVFGSSKITGIELFDINPVSLVFLFCIGMVAFVSVMISIRTIDVKKGSYVNLLMTLLIGMNGMVMVSDLFSLYVFLDVIGISSFVMIAMFRSRKGLEGSIKYLIISEIASIFILMGLSFISMKTGSLSFKDIGRNLLTNTFELQTILIYAAIILMIAGFSIKAGIVPFHSWLPDAHQSADTSISVLLSGIVIKIAGIYGIYVLTNIFGGIKAYQVSLAGLGIISVVVGALLAACQSHFKRIVAYSSVSQMGYILLGLSTGSTLGIVGAVAHVFSHAAFKSTLFTNAAAIHEQTGTLEIDEMGGLQSRMPVTAFSSTIAFLSTAGIPPFAGFWSKLLIVMALWGSGNQILAGFALCASILTSAYFLRLQKKVFFGKTPEHLSSVTEVTGSIKFAEILLTAVTCIVGVLFPLIIIFLHSRGLI
ncbi:MAG: proton-conducting transporter membrane subunit [Bacillota bacterium]|nr:proton-conducting transporter membrane subunit [Bacillota bacterium]